MPRAQREPRASYERPVDKELAALCDAFEDVAELIAASPEYAPDTFSIVAAREGVIRREPARWAGLLSRAASVLSLGADPHERVFGPRGKGGHVLSSLFDRAIQLGSVELLETISRHSTHPLDINSHISYDPGSTLSALRLATDSSLELAAALIARGALVNTPSRCFSFCSSPWYSHLAELQQLPRGHALAALATLALGRPDWSAPVNSSGAPFLQYLVLQLFNIGGERDKDMLGTCAALFARALELGADPDVRSCAPLPPLRPIDLLVEMSVKGLCALRPTVIANVFSAGSAMRGALLASIDTMIAALEAHGGARVLDYPITFQLTRATAAVTANNYAAEAALAGFPAALDAALRAGHAPDVTFLGGVTLLAHAASSSHDTNGASPAQMDELWRGKLACVRALLASGACPFQPSRVNDTRRALLLLLPSTLVALRQKEAGASAGLEAIARELQCAELQWLAAHEADAAALARALANEVEARLGGEFSAALTRMRHDAIHMALGCGGRPRSVVAGRALWAAIKEAAPLVGAEFSRLAAAAPPELPAVQAGQRFINGGVFFMEGNAVNARRVFVLAAAEGCADAAVALASMDALGV